MRLWILLISLVISSCNAGSAVFSNRLVVGDDSPTSDKKIEANVPVANKPFLKFDPNVSQWRFSNDGVTDAEIGSGGGGGGPVVVDTGVANSLPICDGTGANVCSGFYIPNFVIVTPTIITNVIPQTSTYTIVGNVLTVSFQGTVSWSGSGGFSFRLSLPYDQSRTGSDKCTGVMSTNTSVSLNAKNSGLLVEFSGSGTVSGGNNFRAVVMCTVTNTF